LLHLQSFLKIAAVRYDLANAITCTRFNHGSSYSLFVLRALIDDAQRSAFPPKSIIRPRA